MGAYELIDAVFLLESQQGSILFAVFARTNLEQSASFRWSMTLEIPSTEKRRHLEDLITNIYIFSSQNIET